MTSHRTILLDPDVTDDDRVPPSEVRRSDEVQELRGRRLQSALHESRSVLRGNETPMDTILRAAARQLDKSESPWVFIAIIAAIILLFLVVSYKR